MPSLALSAAAIAAQCMAGSDTPQSEVKSSKSTPGAMQCKVSPCFTCFPIFQVTNFGHSLVPYWTASHVFHGKNQALNCTFSIQPSLELFLPQVEWLEGSGLSQNVQLIMDQLEMQRSQAGDLGVSFFFRVEYFIPCQPTGAG